jgi:hypothetical protein
MLISSDQEKYQALVQAMAARCGFGKGTLRKDDGYGADPAYQSMAHAAIHDPEGPLYRTTLMLVEALVALEIGTRVEIVTSDAGRAGHLSAMLSMLAGAAYRFGRDMRPGFWIGLLFNWPGGGQEWGDLMEIRLLDPVLRVAKSEPIR